MSSSEGSLFSFNRLEARRNLVDQDDNRGIGPFHEARVALSSNPSQQDERKRALGFGVRFISR
ncbi:unnamed protein product [Prunus armeniaca]|uniref:Uncharacterized protein n=1 Tax=Prunus armeniaca TaxID=36596 RepID=A0A6J5U7J2_PRUAR|nr:unnamed protein product [Prunus armeniaca]CAB4286185.1 unnamed protein product [Prunus armeniaca]